MTENKGKYCSLNYFSFAKKTKIIFICFIIFNGISNSQLKGLSYDNKLLFQGMSGVNISAFSQNWTIKDFGKVSQNSVPISFTIPITNRILLSLTNTPVSTKRLSDANEIREAIDEKVQNISDTRIALSYVLPGDKIWLNGNVNVPTGLTKLNPAQFEIARVVSQSGFGYRVPVFGQGTNGVLGFSYAYTVNRRLTFGYGGSFGYKGKFNPYVVTIDTVKNESEYNPGEDFSANFGADYTTQNKKNRFSGDITLTETKSDEVNNRKSFKPGTRANIFLVYQFKEDEVSHLINLRMRIKDKNKIYTDTTMLTNKSAQQFEVQYNFKWMAAMWLHLSTFVDLKIHNGDQIPFGDVIFEIGRARVGTLGAEITLLPSRNIALNMGTKYNLGNISIEENYYRASGFEVNLSSRILF